MSHSYASCLYHCVWSTKQRQRIIIPELRERLWPYIGGIAKQNRMKALAIGGVEDHVHVLLSLPSSVSVSKSLQLIKGGSSKWVHDTFPEQRHFLGKKDTVLSASESHRLTTPSATSSGKRNTTDNVPIRTSSSPFWRNTTSNMIRVTSGTNDASRQSSLTGLTFGNRDLVTQR